MMRGSCDSDSFIGDNIDIFFDSVGEAMARIDAQIHFMVSIRNIERFGQFPWPGTKPAFIIKAAPFFHQGDPTKRLSRPNQDKAVRYAFHEHVQHPVRAVTKINISRAGIVSLHERAGRWTRESVAGFVVLGQVGFGFDNFPGAFPPDQLSSYELTGASNRIASEKSCPNDSVSHTCSCVALADRWKGKVLKTLCLVINRDLHFTSHRLSIPERRNKFRLTHILEGGIAESEKWRLFAEEFEIL